MFQVAAFLGVHGGKMAKQNDRLTVFIHFHRLDKILTHNVLAC